MPQAFLGFIGKVFAAGFWKTIAGRIVLSVMIGAVQSRLAKMQADKAKAANAGIRGEQTVAGSKNSLSAILGRYATGGVMLCPPYSWGKNNIYLTYVVAVSFLPGVTLNRLIVDGEVVELDVTTHADLGQNVLGKYAGYIGVRWLDGSQVVANSFLISKFGSHPERPWQSDMIGTGMTIALLTFRYKDSLFSGYPDFRFDLNGIVLYDIRKDTTAGGSGAHRWDNPATWEFTTNPVVMIYNIKRNISFQEIGAWGGGASADAFRYSEWAAAMNKCDTPISGSLLPRYEAGYEFLIGDQPMAVIGELMRSCGADVADVGGVWRISVGEPDAPVFTFTDDDLQITDSAEFDPFPSITQTKNSVAVSYVEPDALWEATEAQGYRDADAVLSDENRELPDDLSLSAVFRGDQAQDLGVTLGRDNRRFRSHVWPMPRQAVVLEPLDTVVYTSDHNGYVDKLFEIGTTTRDILEGMPRINGRERDPDDYDFTMADVVPFAPVSPVTPVPVIEVDLFDAQPYTVTDGVGPRRPAIRLTWNADAFPFASGIVYQIRTTTGAVLVAEGSVNNPAAGSAIITSGISPGISYQVHAAAIAEGYDTTFSGWITVIAPDVRLTLSDLTTAIAANLTALDTWITSGFDLPADVLALATTQRTLLEQMRTFAAELTEGSSQQVMDVQASASAINALTVLVAESNGVITAIADSLQSLTATVGQSTAQGLLRISAEATPAGALSRIGLKVAASTEEHASIRSAALYLEARANDEGAVIINTDKFAITTGQGDQTIAPFIVIDGVVYLNEVFINGMASFGGTLESDDFVDGVSGWQITQDGDAQFNSLIDRSDLQNGAVSDVWQAVLETPIPGNTAQTLVLNIGAVARGSLLRRGVVFEAKKVGFNNVALQRRSRQLGGSFTAWVDIVTWNQDDFSTDWDVYSSGGNLNGYYDEYEYRLSWSASSTGGAAWIRNIYVTVADVKK